MRIRPLVLLAPLVVAGSLTLAVPATVTAAGGMTETGNTTYTVIPSKSSISVSVEISINNTTPNETTSAGVVYYYWNYTNIVVPVSAGPITATSNAGTVSQALSSSDQSYKVVKLSYPNVYYGQTRVVTATYSIPAGSGAKGGYRAGAAYASLCAVGNGTDTGSVSVVVPDGFSLQVLSGGDLTMSGDTGGQQTFSSGKVPTPVNFFSCVEATDATGLGHTAVTAAGQAFDLQSWPDDSTWAGSIRGQLAGDVQRLEDLTGLKMPGGTIAVTENAGGVNDNGVFYNAKTRTLSLPEAATPSQVTQGLAHIWFNDALFKDRWVSEGLAGYAEQAAGQGNYTPCAAPGAYPGSGDVSLEMWQKLTYDSSLQDTNVAAWQSDTACYFFTTLEKAMGTAGFKAVMTGIANGEMAYQGATPAEKLANSPPPLTSTQVLDLFDELGMVPGSVTDLDTAQNLLSPWGVFDSATLGARSASRKTYHALETAARDWKLPLAVRAPMSNWDFAAANKAMTTAGQILALRDQIVAQLPGFSLDGTEIQKRFQSAATQADLDSVLTLTRREADAGTQIGDASKLEQAGRGVLQTIGLLGTDPGAALKQARTDLQNDDPGKASAEAQAVIDQMNGSNTKGLERTLLTVLAIGLLVLLGCLLVLLRRRLTTPAPDPTDEGGDGLDPPGGGADGAGRQAKPAPEAQIIELGVTSLIGPKPPID